MVKENGMVMMSEAEYNELLCYKKGFKREMPDELQEMLTTASLHCSCGYIPSYYDREAPEEYRYADSVLVHNFFSVAEEVCDYLLEEKIEAAEGIIKGFVEDEFNIDEE